MVKVKKISVVNLEDNEVKNDDVLVEVVDDKVIPDEIVVTDDAIVVDNVVTPDEKVEMKTKAKAKAKAKPKTIEAIEAIKEEEEILEVLEEDKKEIQEMTSCPRCNKKLTVKGLKYSHKCPFDKVQKMEEANIKEPVILKEKNNYNISEEYIENEIRKRMQASKDNRELTHSENMKRLASRIV